MIEENKRGIKNVIPSYWYVEDQRGNRFFIDIWSKPWYFLFWNFRIFFPVNAILLDDNCYFEKMLIGASKKKKGYIKNRVLVVIGLTILFLWVFKDSMYFNGEVYTLVARIILIVLIIILYISMVIRKKKVFKRERLDEMRKIKIRIRPSLNVVAISISWFVIIYNGYISFFEVPHYLDVSIVDLFLAVIFGFLILATFFLQWCIILGSKIKIYE